MLQIEIVLIALLAVVAKASDFNYSRIIEYSLLFYEAQRSGVLPTSNRIPWRSNSALGDRGNNNEDLTGGYYDAGDYVKFSLPTAFTVTILSWGLLSSKTAYIQSGQYEECLSAIRWGAEYLIKCHTSPYEFYGQVGSFTIDHDFWGRPEDMNLTRPAFKIDSKNPGSDLAGEAAAALAAASIVFRKEDAKFSNLCSEHSQQLYQLATEHLGFIHDALPEASLYYHSSGYGDELAWSAAWLFKGTADKRYLADARHFYDAYEMHITPNQFSYDVKTAGVQVLLGQMTTENRYQQNAEEFCTQMSEQQKSTPKGLVFIDKVGALCHSANVAFICLQVANFGRSKSEAFQEFSKKQIDYMLGDGGRSYVVGFGENPPTQPHHAASSCLDRPAVCDWSAFNSLEPNPQILYGALVAGPDDNDFFDDTRKSYIYTEVACDCNAGFQSAVAMIKQLQIDQQPRIRKGQVNSLHGLK